MRWRGGAARRLLPAAGLLLALGLWSAPEAGATAPYAAKLPPLTTPWTQSVSTVAPLPDYPRPQLERTDWLNLNGRWQYQRARAGERAAVRSQPRADDPRAVPGRSRRCRGSSAGTRRAGTGARSRCRAAGPGGIVLLNFGAVSWAARVYVNGRLAGTHRGDYDSFSFDITRLLSQRGANELVVGYVNPIGGAGEPVGKQIAGAPYAIYHTASSGIWQTVWLEPVRRGTCHAPRPDARSAPRAG